MIKLSRLTDYAVVIMAALARGDGALSSASALAADLSLPEPTVAKVLKILAKGGLVNSARGVSGGYSLAARPAAIRVSAIIEAMEGPIALTSCISGSHDTCGLETVCQLRGRWNVVNTAIKTALDNVTLADIMPSGRARVRVVAEKGARA